MARIFERFERGVEQRSGGFGIGLWIVRNICVAMGGTVTVKASLETERVSRSCCRDALRDQPGSAELELSQVIEQRTAVGTTADRHPGA